MQNDERRKLITGNPIKLLTDYSNHEDLGVIMAINIFSKYNSIDNKFVEKSIPRVVDKDSHLYDTLFVSFRTGLMNLITGKKNYTPPYKKILRGFTNRDIPLFNEQISGSLKTLWTRSRYYVDTLLDGLLDPTVYEHIIRIASIIRIYLDPSYKYYALMTPVDRVVAKILLHKLEVDIWKIREYWDEAKPLELRPLGTYHYDKDKNKLYTSDKSPYKDTRDMLIEEAGGLTVRYSEFVESTYWSKNKGSNNDTMKGYRLMALEPPGFGQLYHETLETAYSVYAGNKLPFIYTIGEYSDMISKVERTTEARRTVKILRNALTKPKVQDTFNEDSVLFKMEEPKDNDVSPLLDSIDSITFIQDIENSKQVESVERILNEMDFNTFILFVFGL